jgi:exonuclease SbcD
MIKILHFADAHIDMARQGARDPETGLSIRVMDFLKSLDFITETAIKENVDLVVFAGDAYRDRTPSPTYQREFARRIIKMAEKAQVILVVGNHDISPATGRAHTLQEFQTLNPENIHVIDRPCILGAKELGGLEVQVIGVPWLNRSGAFAAGVDLEEGIEDIIHGLMEQLDPKLPAILTAHATVQGAVYSSERSVMLGRDLVLSKYLLNDPRLDYVALGHIHNYQNLNEGNPPIIYPGSIERVDFGEVDDRKTCVYAEVERGNTKYNAIDLPGRKFIDLSFDIKTREDIQKIEIPDVEGAMFRLVLNYPKELEPLIDEITIRKQAEGAFGFHLVKRPVIEQRMRIPEGHNVANMTPMELLQVYWEVTGVEETEELNGIAKDIFEKVEEK